MIFSYFPSCGVQTPVIQYPRFRPSRRSKKRQQKRETTMPNQRKKGKTRIAVWLTPEQREALDRMIEAGVAKDMSDFVIKAIDAEYKKDKETK